MPINQKTTNGELELPDNFDFQEDGDVTIQVDRDIGASSTEGGLILKQGTQPAFSIAPVGFGKLLIKKGTDQDICNFGDEGIATDLDVSCRHLACETFDVGPQSIYLGNNMRLSSDLVNHELVIAERNPNSMPSALNSYSLTDVQAVFPTISALSQVTVNQWLQFGRAKLGSSKKIGEILLNADYTSHSTIADIDGSIANHLSRIQALEGTYSNTQVDSAIATAVANLVDSAPANLSTLNDLAASLNDDQNYATTITNALAGKQNSIADGDLTIAKTNGLQTELDTKAPKSDPTLTTKVRVEGSGGVQLRSAVGGLGVDFIVQYDGHAKLRNFQSTDLTFATADTTRLTVKGDGAIQFDGLTASTVPYLDANKRLVSSAVTPTQLGYLDASSSLQTQLDAKQGTIGDGDLTIARTNGLQTALDAKEDTISLTASRAVVSGSGGGLQALTVTSDQVGYLGNLTSDIQSQLNGKQGALTRVNLGQVTWSQANETLTGFTGLDATKKQGYFTVLPTWDLSSGTSAQRQFEITLTFDSNVLTATDYVLVSRHPMCNHDGGAITCSFWRPNSDLNNIRMSFRANVTRDYTNNTTEKYVITYLVL